MRVVELTNKEQLNKFVGAQKHSQFLQSWEWGELQEKMGNKVLQYGIEDNGEMKFAIQLIRKSLPLGKAYFYAPRIGIKFLSENDLKFLFDGVKKIAKDEKVIFLRFEPRSQLKIKNYELKIIKTIDVQPSKTLILDLGKSEEELLKNMHQKTRYNIRLAEKRGVKIIESDEDRFEDFWRLMSETSIRDNFRLHSREYYKKMIDCDDDFIKLFIAEYERKVVAINIISFFGDMATYLHGASSHEYRNVMAPHALQWHVIKLAKGLGYKYYDFYGIDENKWPGVTRFKGGFCVNAKRLHPPVGRASSSNGTMEPSIVEYPGTFDLVFNRMWYGIYRATRRIRRNL